MSKKKESLSPSSKKEEEKDFMNIFRRIDLNNVNPEMIEYLKSNDSLY